MPEIVDLRKGSRDLKRGVAELYCEVFQEEPWNEIFKPDEVLVMTEEQFAKRGAIALVLVDGEKPVGFVWAYEILRGGLREGTRHPPALGFLFDGSKGERRVYYLQEIGVKPRLQGQGFGKRLAQEFLRKAREGGAEVVILSTNPKSEAMIRMISKIGFQNSGIVRPPKELGRTYWTFEFEE